MYGNADAETLAERELLYEEAFRSVGIDFKNLKKRFWEDDELPVSFHYDTMSAWNDERAFHGYSVNRYSVSDYLYMKINTSNGKLHQILELLPSSESASELPSNEKEPDGDLAEGRVFAGPEFAQWRLRVQNLKERVKLRAGYTLKQFVSSMEPDEAKCYVLDTDDDVAAGGSHAKPDVAVGGKPDGAVGGKPDVAVGGKPKYGGEVEFQKIQGLYWIAVCRGYNSMRNTFIRTKLLDDLLKRGEAMRSVLYDEESDTEESCWEWQWRMRVRAAEVAVTFFLPPCDWRELGLKVVLYELLAEDFFSDPTGRQNIVPERRLIKTERFNLRLRNELQFSAVVLSFEAVAMALENGMLIDGKECSLLRNEVVFVILNEHFYQPELTWALWTLVHLEYPLVEVVDTYSIRWNLHETREGLFIRTAGLVNMLGRSSRVIVFCVSKTTTFNFFEFTFKVVNPTKTGKVIATSWNAGPLLDRMINCVLQSKENLRYMFNLYTRGMLYANWLEIDALVSLLVVRWSRQPEAVVVTDEDGKKHLRLERVSLAEESIEHRGVANANCTRRVFDDYNDVNSVDVIFVDSYCNYDHFLVIGSWCNVSEFCLCSGFYSLNTEDDKDSNLVSDHTRTGALGLLTRASYLRVAFEGWKRLVGIGDEIVTPYSFKFDTTYTVLEDSNGFRNVKEFLETIISTKSLMFSWCTNSKNKVEFSLTGIRTGPVHRNLDSWQLKRSSQGENLHETFTFNVRGWFLLKVGRFDLDGIRSTKCDHMMACVDWVDQSDNIASTSTYSGVPNEAPFPMRLFSSWQLELAFSAGWRFNVYKPIDICPFLVGWGIPAWRRDWDHFQCVKTTGGRESLINIMMACTWPKGQWKNCYKAVNPSEDF